MIISGTTIYVGTFELETIYGVFTAKIYQNLIHKGYIIALCHGDITADVLTTRIHSSCVTSETLCSMDCDCVFQLNGAIEEISKTNGILFYLIQEGRGCGYVGKSRGCMIVQASEQQCEHSKVSPLTTFDAYNILGMKADYRDYSNVKDICKMLNISPEWILLSNNPDKIAGMQAANQIIQRIKSIEIPPNPFNHSYLLSKQQSGHLLYQVKTKCAKKYYPPSQVFPFDPHQLKEYPRFIYCSSYYLPITPQNNKVLVSKEELDLHAISSDSYVTLQKSYLIDSRVILQNSYLIDLHAIKNSCSDTFESIRHNPYWFKVHVYYDLITHLDFVVLCFDQGDTTKTPLVRIHSESIFNRFPLKHPKYRLKYQTAVSKIVEYGYGYIFLMYHDGRGASLANLCLNMEKKYNLVDNRDYRPILDLIEKHIPEKHIHILHSGSSRILLEDTLKLDKFTVESWIHI